MGGKNSGRYPSPELVERNAMICDRLRAGGTTMAAMGRELGLTTERVRQIALRAGVTASTYHALLPPSKTVLRSRAVEAARQARRDRKAALVAVIVELRGRGLDQKQIGEAVGVSQNTVSDFLIEAGHRTVYHPIRVFRKTQRKPRSKNRAIGAPLIVGIPKNQQTPHEPEVIQAALTLWEKGLSAQRIALRLTTKERPMSKNVIIGIAHRNAFPPRQSPLSFQK